jgi:hypothetical protein
VEDQAAAEVVAEEDNKKLQKPACFMQAGFSNYTNN